MNRRELLEAGLGAVGITGVCGLGCRITQDELAVAVRNTTTDDRAVTIEVRTGEVLHFTDSFEVPADQTVERVDVAGSGEYTLRMLLDDREDREFEHRMATQFCHESRAIFEIGMAGALAVYTDCNRL